MSLLLGAGIERHTVYNLQIKYLRSEEVFSWSTKSRTLDSFILVKFISSFVSLHAWPHIFSEIYIEQAINTHVNVLGGFGLLWCRQDQNTGTGGSRAENKETFYSTSKFQDKPHNSAIDSTTNGSLLSTGPDLKRLADQDPELAQLSPKDLAFEERAAREAGWRKRDKLVRVSVTEFRKHLKKEGQEITGGKKKKRR
ncbi:hypothetical protein BJ742DRAFT_742025 [Cladochytrium replicatum]|nr:hypothetical protein BJ742DRAFT_742025 [Cladochytrium replicatum]